MTTFKDLDSQDNVSVPVDLEQRAVSRTTSRVRKQRMFASALASVLLVSVLGVAFAANTSSGSKVNPTNKNRLGKIKGDDKTTNTVVGQDDQGEDSNDVSTTVETRGNDDDNETHDSGVTSTTHDDENEVEQEDDHSSTSTTEIDDHSGSNSGSGSSD